MAALSSSQPVLSLTTDVPGAAGLNASQSFPANTIDGHQLVRAEISISAPVLPEAASYFVNGIVFTVLDGTTVVYKSRIVLSRLNYESDTYGTIVYFPNAGLLGSDNKVMTVKFENSGLTFGSAIMNTLRLR